MKYNYPDSNGFFGKYGGAYVPNSVKDELDNISNIYFSIDHKSFFKSFYRTLCFFSSRPSKVYFAERLSKSLGCSNIFFKREDYNFTSSHKINNVIGQIMLAKLMGKKQVVCETGAGQHGLAVATIAPYFGMSCKVFMGKKDCLKQSLNFSKISFLGADLITVNRDNQDLSAAIDEAIMYWIDNKDSYYLLGSAVGPHPYPTLVRDFQSIIGSECLNQFNTLGINLDYIVACVGGGSNSIGIFYKYIRNNCSNVELVGVEACGTNISNSVFNMGTTSVLHGCKTLVLKKNGLIPNINSISSGLNYPSVGPEHSFLYKKGIVKYKSVCNKEALDCFKKVALYERIFPSLESSHAISEGIKIALNNRRKKKNILVNFSGNGDKDIDVSL